ncbi:MAG: hypothetical protein U5K75_00055 [Ahrensia sp.]|nr:hypothetical protein [Ahrensia sp.]
MKNIFDLSTVILRNADAGGSVPASAPAPAATPTGAPAGTAEAPANANQGSAQAEKPAAGGDNGQTTALPSATVYTPEGIDAAMLGQTDQETIDKLHKAMIDGRGTVPEDANGYMDFSGAEVPDNLKPYVGALSDDPVFKAVGEWAHGKQMDKGLMQEGLLVAYKAAAEGGFLSPMVDQVAEKRLTLYSAKYGHGIERTAKSSSKSAC